MKYSADLHELINTLSKAEKRYFKLFADLQSGEKNYLKLFEAIDRVTNYDEDKIMKKVGIPQKDFSVAKNYLYTLILKSMRMMYENRNLNGKLYNMLLDAEFLEAKGLYNHVSKFLNRADKLTAKYDRIDDHIKVKMWQMRLAMTEGSMEKEVGRLQEDIRRLLEDYTVDANISLLTNNLFMAMRQERELRTEEAKEELNRLFEDPLLQDGSNIHTFHGKSQFFRMKSMYHRLKGEVESFNEFQKKNLELWYEYPDLQKEKKLGFIVTMGNYLQSCIPIKRFEEFPDVLDRMRKMKLSSFDEQAEAFQNVPYLELIYCMNTDRLEAAIDLVPEIEGGLKKFDAKINQARRVAFPYNVSILFFIVEDFQKSLEWLNRIINDKWSQSRQDILRLSRILQLILHFELDNTDVLDYMLNSTYKMLLNREGLHEFEQVVIRHMRKVPFTPDKESRQDQLLKFKAQLEEVYPDDAAKPLGFEEIMLWLKSRTEGRPIREILREEST